MKAKFLNPALSFLALTFALPLTIVWGIGTLGEALYPYTAKYPGLHTPEDPDGPVPETVRAFLPFKHQVGLSWDDTWLYVEGNGLPQHGMMTGITAWQQQVPLPHDFTGPQAFRIPLHPKVLEEPGELTLLGPLAIAVNGIPIFHGLTQSGKDAYLGGELDHWGGHCGRADDYHYHIAPTHLQAQAGEGMPIAFALDGFPIYAADPENPVELDECHGYYDAAGNYRYVGELKPPYVLGGFRGEADLDTRPRTGPIRPALQPLRGAEITGFSGSLTEGYTLNYDVRGQENRIDYHLLPTGGAAFTFTDGNGETRQETYDGQRRGGGGGGPGGGGGNRRGDNRPGERRPPPPPPPGS